MTTRYTNEEWGTIIADIKRDVLVTEDPNAYPAIGSVDFARTIDHTLLKLDATSKQIDDLCAEARVAEFATVCVRPNFVAQAVADLKGSPVQVASVIGFHEGTYDLSHKLGETRQALEDGAHELDVVINWPQLQAGHYSIIYNELAAIRSIAPDALLKLIFETSQLSAPQIVAATIIAGHANFDYVKTSTGFLGHGAKKEHVQLMVATCKALKNRGVGKRAGMKVKASGGIRTLEDAVTMLETGAQRLGTSGGVWITKEGRQVAEGKVEGQRPGMATRLFTDY